MVIAERAKKIRIVATDIDGVWTAGHMHFDADGDWGKSFNTLDGYATALASDSGMDVVVLTGEDAPAVRQRMKKLRVAHYYPNEWHKRKRMEYLCKVRGFELENVAYIGDDINDLDLLRVCGIAATVPNGTIAGAFLPDYICKRRGGEGAFREFVDLLITLRN